MPRSNARAITTRCSDEVIIPKPQRSGGAHTARSVIGHLPRTGNLSVQHPAGQGTGSGIFLAAAGPTSGQAIGATMTSGGGYMPGNPEWLVGRKRRQKRSPNPKI